MNKCFVLGAGFSKAVAGLPLMREIVRGFWNLRDDPKNSKNTALIERCERVKEFLDGLKQQALTQWIEPNPLNKNKALESDYAENLETVLSQIDLHMSSPPVARFEDQGHPVEIHTAGLPGYAVDLAPMRMDIEELCYHVLVSCPGNSFTKSLEFPED